MPSRGQQLGKLLNRSGDIVPASLPPKIETFSQSVTNTGKVETAALPTAIADLETIGQTLSGGEIVPSSIKSNTLTQSFSENQAVTFNMADSIDAVSPILSVFKEVPQAGFSSKGQWDVNANATNYEFFDEKPISYSSVNLTPSATGDGTFTSSSMIIGPTDIDNLTYDNKSINITSLNHTGTGTYGDLRGFYIKPDGTKLFSLSTAGIVSEHVLSTAYDISTTTYNNVDTSALTTESSAAFDTNLALSPDGTKLFVLKSATKEIARYDLSTAWNLSTLSTTKHSYYIESANLNTPISFTFNADGTVLIIFYNSTDAIAKYDLSTAWDLSTASRASFTIVANSSSSTAYVGSTSGIDLHSLEFTNNGNVLLGSDYAQQKIYQWNLTSPYSITSTSLVYDTQFSITLLAGNNSSYGPGPLRVLNGKAYIVDGGTKSIIYQYTSSASNVFNAADVGKKVVGNSGSAIITATSGAYKSVTAFADTSAISSWQLFGAEGKSDGSGISLTASSAGSFDVSGASDTGRVKAMSPIIKTMAGAYASVYTKGAYMKPDGTQFFIQYSGAGGSGRYLYSIPLTTAYDISTATSTGAVQGNYNTDPNMVQYGGIFFKPDGTSLYFTDTDYTNSAILQFNMSTAWAVNTMSLGTKKLVTNAFLRVPAGIFFSQDGTKMFLSTRNYNISGSGAPHLVRMTLSTPWDLSTAGTSPDTNQTLNMTNLVSTGDARFDGAGQINSTGTKIVFQNSYITTTPPMFVGLELSTPYDLTTATVTENRVSGGTGGAGTGHGSFVHLNGLKAYVQSGDGSTNYFHEYDVGEAASINYNSYSPALTNSSTGQINSSSWLDINSMTADETKNDGDVFYAVSTDNRTSWGVAKASTGVRKIARNNSGTWQYNNDGGSVVGYGLANETYDNKNFDTTADTSEEAEQGIAVSSDGTKFYITGYQEDKVFQFDMSTPFDLSTGAYNNVSYTLTGLTHPWGLFFKPDGTKMYVLNPQSTATISEYALSTAWDVSTASHTATENYSAGPTYESYGLFFKSDGSKVYILRYNSTIYSWNLTTPWDITTGSYIGVTSAFLNSNSGRDILFNDDGLKMYLLLYDGSPNTYYIREYDLSTAWDPSTASYNNISFQPGLDLGGSSTTITAMCWANSGKKLYVTKSKSSGGSNYGANSFTTTTTGFGTSETWVNGTNNNEHATLQEALGTQSFNRMNKAQLDAVADGYHFSQDSANTLDLMIAPYAASGSSPISDGVTINYDAEALIREAIPGTDYIADFPNPTTLNITAVGAANLKIRAQ